MLSQARREFIEFMMSADVLRFGEFKTKSGRLSPYFVNTGNYRTGSQIAALGKFYAACIKESCGTDFTAMFGPAYKGIPLVTAAAGELASQYGIDKPYFFNRKEAKDHGEGGSLVGYQPKDGDRILIIEDVITAGTAGSIWRKSRSTPGCWSIWIGIWSSTAASDFRIFFRELLTKP